MNDHLKGHPNNQHAKKLKTPELREEAYKQYCDWISLGKSKEAWRFQHPEMSLTSKTMEKYIRECPSDFPAIHKEIAEAASFDHWCELGKQMMLGQIKGCQPAIFQMFMRNKFGWDKDTQVSHTFEPEARRLLDIWENRN